MELHREKPFREGIIEYTFEMDVKIYKGWLNERHKRFNKFHFKNHKAFEKNYDHNAEGQQNLYIGHQELYNCSMKNGYVALVS